MYVDARHPGANHDSFIWEQSALDQRLQNEFDNGKRNTWILGNIHTIIVEKKCIFINYFVCRRWRL